MPCPEIFSRYLEDSCELIDDQLRVAVDTYFLDAKIHRMFETREDTFILCLVVRSFAQIGASFTYINIYISSFILYFEINSSSSHVFNHNSINKRDK